MLCMGACHAGEVRRANSRSELSPPYLRARPFPRLEPSPALPCSLLLTVLKIPTLPLGLWGVLTRMSLVRSLTAAASSCIYMRVREAAWMDVHM